MAPSPQAERKLLPEPFSRRFQAILKLSENPCSLPGALDAQEDTFLVRDTFCPHQTVVLHLFHAFFPEAKSKENLIKSFAPLTLFRHPNLLRVYDYGLDPLHQCFFFTSESFSSIPFEESLTILDSEELLSCLLEGTEGLIYCVRKGFQPEKLDRNHLFISSQKPYALKLKIFPAVPQALLESKEKGLKALIDSFEVFIEQELPPQPCEWKDRFLTQVEQFINQEEKNGTLPHKHLTIHPNNLTPFETDLQNPHHVGWFLDLSPEGGNQDFLFQEIRLWFLKQGFYCLDFFEPSLFENLLHLSQQLYWFTGIPIPKKSPKSDKKIPTLPLSPLEQKYDSFYPPLLQTLNHCSKTLASLAKKGPCILLLPKFPWMHEKSIHLLTKMLEKTLLGEKSFPLRILTQRSDKDSPCLPPALTPFPLAPEEIRRAHGKIRGKQSSRLAQYLNLSHKPLSLQELSYLQEVDSQLDSSLHGSLKELLRKGIIQENRWGQWQITSPTIKSWIQDQENDCPLPQLRDGLIKMYTRLTSQKKTQRKFLFRRKFIRLHMKKKVI